jgi:hypothetical protein
VYVGFDFDQRLVAAADKHIGRDRYDHDRGRHDGRHDDSPDDHDRRIHH